MSLSVRTIPSCDPSSCSVRNRQDSSHARIWSVVDFSLSLVTTKTWISRWTDKKPTKDWKWFHIHSSKDDHQNIVRRLMDCMTFCLSLRRTFLYATKDNCGPVCHFFSSSPRHNMSSLPYRTLFWQQKKNEFGSRRISSKPVPPSTDEEMMTGPSESWKSCNEKKKKNKLHSLLLTQRETKHEKLMCLFMFSHASHFKNSLPSLAEDFFWKIVS